MFFIVNVLCYCYVVFLVNVVNIKENNFFKNYFFLRMKLLNNKSLSLKKI